MKKTLLIVALVCILALSVTGYVYAQDEDPDTPFGPGEFSPGMMGWVDEDGPMHEVMQAAIAEALGLSVEELETAHDAGKTAWDIAQEQGLDEVEFSTLMLEARSTALAQALADGVITQEQADWIQSRWDYMQENGFGPGSDFFDEGGGHRGGRRGPGGCWDSQP